MNSYIVYKDKIVSKLGIGTSAYGSRVNQKDANFIIETLINKGINYIDTSPYYGFGNAERIVAKSIQGKRNELFISTKFGISIRNSNSFIRKLIPWSRKIYSIPGVKNAFKKTSGNYIIDKILTVEQVSTSIYSSLKNLRVEYLDLLIVHNNIGAYIEDNELIDYLLELRNKQIIFNYGVSTNQLDESIVNKIRLEKSIETIQIPYVERYKLVLRDFRVTYFSLFSSGMPNMHELKNMILSHNGHFIVLITNKYNIDKYLSYYK